LNSYSGVCEVTISIILTAAGISLAVGEFGDIAIIMAVVVLWKKSEVINSRHLEKERVTYAEKSIQPDRYGYRYCARCRE
jgi:hypothetical protein